MSKEEINDSTVQKQKRKYDKWTKKASSKLFKNILNQDKVPIIDWKLVSYELKNDSSSSQYDYSARSCYDHFTQFKRISYKLGFNDARYLLKLLSDYNYIWDPQVFGPDNPELRQKLSKIMGQEVQLLQQKQK